MIRIYSGLLFLLILSFAPELYGQDNRTTPQVIRVLSYNILHGATVKRNNDLDLVADFINQLKPDLIALQEVDYKTKRAEYRDISTLLALKVNLSPIFGKAVDFDGGAYGQSLLSRWPFAKTEIITLPGEPEKEPRIALTADIVLPSGDTVNFVGTHLDHLSNSPDRLLQAKRINKWLQQSNQPTILAGDLNDIPGSQTINILESVWNPTYDPEKPEPTFPSNEPKVKIDYIMHSPKNRWKVLEKQVLCHQIASDHCAYLVILELIPEKE